MASRPASERAAGGALLRPRQRLLIAKLRLPDFIVTLGTFSIYRGSALIYVDGQPIYGRPREFRSIFEGRILDVPTPVIVAIVIAALAFFPIRFTALGEQIVSIGGDEEAAELFGVKIEQVHVYAAADRKIAAKAGSRRTDPHAIAPQGDVRAIGPNGGRRSVIVRVFVLKYRDLDRAGRDVGSKRHAGRSARTARRNAQNWVRIGSFGAGE